MKNLYASLLFFVMMGNGLHAAQIDSISFHPKPNGSIDVYVKVTGHAPRYSSHYVLDQNDTIGGLFLFYTMPGFGFRASHDTILNISIPNYDKAKSYLFIVKVIMIYEKIPPTNVSYLLNTDSIAILFPALVGVNENPLKNEVYLYPNPSRDVINIEYPNILDVSAISLIDLQGKKVKRFKEPQKQLSISGISTGQYFLKLETSKGIITKKVLIE